MTSAPAPYVLLVEDDLDILDTVCELLEERGYRTHRATDGNQALLWLRQTSEAPSLILLDLMMPSMDGWQFRAEQLKDPKTASIPVVVLSADSDPASRASGLAASAYLRKPIGLDDLLAVVARVCGAPPERDGSPHRA